MKSNICDYPEVIKLWHPTLNGNLNPDMFSSGSHKKIYWKCKNGHKHHYVREIRSQIKNDECAICNNIVLEKGYNDFKTMFPEISKMWDFDLNNNMPNTVLSNSGKIYYWKCKKGHGFRKSIGQMKSNHKCPTCAKRVSKDNYKKRELLINEYPSIANLYHPQLNEGVSIDTLTCGSHIQVVWKCDNGYNHVYKTQVKNKVKSKGCPICLNKVLLKGFNDLATMYPNVAKEWHPTLNGEVTPEMVFAGSIAKAWWICSYNHVTHVTISSRTRGSKCRLCYQKGL